MARDPKEELATQLATSIADDVGSMREDELDAIGQAFDKTLNDALKAFNSTAFTDDGFIRRMRDLDLGEGKTDNRTVKSVLNSVREDFISPDAFNQTEISLRRDLLNICQQMPEMQDVIKVIRDAIIECNVSTGEVSRSIIFDNHINTEALESVVKDIEKRHDLLMAIKNFIVPNTLKTGEMYIHVVPYAKLFAELEMMRDERDASRTGQKKKKEPTEFHESIPATIREIFHDSKPKSLFSEDNVKALMESVDQDYIAAGVASYQVHHDNSTRVKGENIAKESISGILKQIDVYNGASPLMTEIGMDGFREFVMMEYADSERSRNPVRQDKKNPGEHFEEALGMGSLMDRNDFSRIDQDDVDTKNYRHIKGCYVKYMNSLRMVPIRIDRRVVGYYYVTTTMDLQNNPANPSGLVDLSFQQYTRDHNMVDRLAGMIINSFDRKMLERNIQLKDEIAEIIMAHKFGEGKLSFVYIPENEIVRLVINEDENGKGHSVLEPSIFPARMYLLLNMYNILYTLNNNTTHIHYLRSSGLNKNYAAQVQRTMRKFQQRRITIDDIYSYSGVLNKIGGMGEMVLPSGRSDIKALEHDTIEAVRNPIDVEFLEQQRRQAISGTGAPSLLVINALDEVDFAKTLEMANTRFLSTVSSYKIDMNRGITKLYQKLLQWDSDMEDDDVRAFKFMFNAIKQQDLVITSDMIQNFNNLVELASAMYYSKEQLEDKDGGLTSTAMNLRRKLAEKYLPQLEFDDLDAIVREVDALSTDDKLKSRVTAIRISNSDLQEIEQ